MVSSSLMVGRMPLADFVRRTRVEKRLSLNDVARQSGHQISNAYVSKIENGYVTNPSPKKLRALAKGLRESEDEVFAIARGVHEPAGFSESRFFEVYELYSHLVEPRHKRIVEDHLGDLVRIIGAFPTKKRADGERTPVVAIRRSK
jgi:transcriptional regulator with XRE-family HTH domain